MRVEEGRKEGGFRLSSLSLFPSHPPLQYIPVPSLSVASATAASSALTILGVEAGEGEERERERERKEEEASVVGGGRTSDSARPSSTP